MNLTDYRETSMLEVFERIKQEAGKLGVAVAHSELIGLVPAAALPDNPKETLQLEGFTEAMILERRL